MELDKTSIVIANRDLRDTLDLSLLVLRHYFKGVLFYSLLGVLPFAILNAFLTWHLTDYTELEYTTSAFFSQTWHWQRYYFIMACAVFLQAPLAFSFLTSFIGQSVFSEVSTPQQVVASVRSGIVRIVLVLGIFRMGLVSLVMLGSIYQSSEFNAVRDVLIYFILLCGSIFLVRMFRPFAPEVLILEGCPLRNRKKDQTDRLSYGRRSKLIYNANGSQVTPNQLASALIAISMILVLCLGSVFCLGVLLGLWDFGVWVDRFIYPLCLWSVAAWMTIVRFLCYLNTRIQIEGWELQLRLRAEAMRLREGNS